MYGVVLPHRDFLVMSFQIIKTPVTEVKNIRLKSNKKTAIQGLFLTVCNPRILYRFILTAE